MNHFSNNQKMKINNSIQYFILDQIFFINAFCIVFVYHLKCFTFWDYFLHGSLLKCIQILLGKCWYTKFFTKKGSCIRVYSKFTVIIHPLSFKEFIKTLTYLRPIRDLNCLFPYLNMLAYWANLCSWQCKGMLTLWTAPLSILSFQYDYIRSGQRERERKRAVITQ